MVSVGKRSSSLLPPPPCDPPCQEDERCSEGQCLTNTEICTADGQCGEGFTCDLSNGECRRGERGVYCAPCDPTNTDMNLECGVGFACVEGLPGCRPRCGSRGPDAPPCDEGESCQEGVCVISSFSICGSPFCLDHSDCPQSACEQGRCTVAQRCEDDADCALGSSCEAGYCAREERCDRSSCGENSLCLGGLCVRQETSASTCEPCRFDTDCPSLSHCWRMDRFAEGRCLSLCETSSGCSDEQECFSFNQANGYCAEMELSCGEMINRCEEDASEPNDLLSTASPVQVSDQQITALSDLKLCVFDDDYFTLSPVAGVNYEVRVITQGPAMLFLYNESGELISEIPNVFPVDTGVTFTLSDIMILQVVGLEERTTEYRIIITPTSPVVSECTGDDSLEENDSLEDSYPIGSGADLTLALCPADEDWFLFRGREGELWNIDMYLREFMGLMELSVGTRVEFDEGNPRSWYFMMDGDQALEHTILSDEPYYLRLRCNGCMETIRYQLTLSR